MHSQAILCKAGQIAVDTCLPSLHANGMLKGCSLAMGVACPCNTCSNLQCQSVYWLQLKCVKAINALDVRLYTAAVIGVSPDVSLCATLSAQATVITCNNISKVQWLVHD